MILHRLGGRLFPASFQRLSWKLTASYTITTVAVLMAVELVVIAFGLVTAVASAQGTANRMAHQLIDEVAPQLSPSLATGLPDRPRLKAWLDEAANLGLRTRGGAAVINAGPEDLQSPRFHLLILDTRQQVVTSFHTRASANLPGQSGALDVPGLAETVPHALAGEHDASLLVWRSLSQLTIAAPIRTSSGAVGGVLLYTLPFGPLATSFISHLLVVATSAIVFTLAAGSIGLIASAVTARGLIRRLDQVAAAAAAWSDGRFTEVIEDRSADELGELSRQLNRMAAQLATLMQTRAELSAVDERNRLARDLHDSVKQHVFAISMNLGAAQSLWERDNITARRRVDGAFELARQSQQELGTIIQTLRPVQLDGTGVRQALREYVAQWQGYTNIAASFEVQGHADVPLRSEEILFRVGQEALANVARHSQATAVHLSLIVEPDMVRLEVCDNGRGFDVARQRPGVGLRSMRERVTAVGGEIELTSGEGGTKLIVRIPSREAAP